MYVCAMFMDLSKTFDIIHHDLMIAKLGVHGFSQDALQYMRSYLTNREQGVRVNSNFSTWENIQTLMAEICKIKNNLNPPIMDFIFERRNNTYNLRNFQEFATERRRTVKMGLETISYRSPQLWSILPENVRQITSVVKFK